MTPITSAVVEADYYFVKNGTKVNVPINGLQTFA